MPITPFSTPPSSTDPDNFDDRADELLAVELPRFVTEANALAEDVNAKQNTASEAATTATTKAGEALDSATNAGISAGNARDSELAAATSESHARDSEVAAGISKVNAATSETNAQSWALSVNPQNLSTDYFGVEEPPITWPGMTWADTGSTPPMLRRRNAADTAWIAEALLFRQSLPGATFAEIDALTADEGPLIATDMDGLAWRWVDTAYFQGYRGPFCGQVMFGWTPLPLPFQIEARGGVWDEADPKDNRVIARYRESGLVCAIGDWVAGPNVIASLGAGQWKAPNLEDRFLRMTGTDLDTANARTLGSAQLDAYRSHDHLMFSGNRYSSIAPGSGSLSGIDNSGPSGNYRTGLNGGAETRGPNTSLNPVICL